MVSFVTFLFCYAFFIQKKFFLVSGLVCSHYNWLYRKRSVYGLLSFKLNVYRMCVCTDPGVQDSVCVGLGSWTHCCWGGKRAVIRDEGFPPETEQETDCPVHTPDTHTHIQRFSSHILYK